MPFALLDVLGEDAMDELRRNPSVKILWVESSAALKPLPAPSDRKEGMQPLLVEPANEQALELLKQLEKLDIIRILP